MVAGLRRAIWVGPIMMTFLIYLVAIIVIIVAVILLMAMTRPKTFRVERSVAINAAPEKIFPLIDNFSNWPLWSPFENLDPNMTKSLAGPANGVGSIYQWS